MSLRVMPRPQPSGSQKAVNLAGSRHAKAYDLSSIIDPEGNQQMQRRVGSYSPG